MMLATRRLTASGGILAWALLGIAMHSSAQDFPSRPIHFVVPYPGGGAVDVPARVVGKKLGENLGWQVVVDNRPGAGGIIAAELVAKAPADGYTLFVATINHLAINPNLYPKLPYDPLKDFVPVTLAVTTPLFLVVNAATPVHSVKELIAYARANPGRLNYASVGNGSQHHLGMELFKLQSGADMTHIPYKGVADSVPALLSGNVALMLVGLTSVLPHVKTGKLRLLAVAEGRRTSLMPELPTIAEAALPGYEISPEIGFVAPAGTPRVLIDKLNLEIVKVLKSPEIMQQLVSVGIDPVGSTPERYADTIRFNMEKYGKLVKISGARVD